MYRTPDLLRTTHLLCQLSYFPGCLSFQAVSLFRKLTLSTFFQVVRTLSPFSVLKPVCLVISLFFPRCHRLYLGNRNPTRKLIASVCSGFRGSALVGCARKRFRTSTIGFGDRSATVTPSKHLHVFPCLST